MCVRSGSLVTCRLAACHASRVTSFVCGSVGKRGGTRTDRVAQASWQIGRWPPPASHACARMLRTDNHGHDVTSDDESGPRPGAHSRTHAGPAGRALPSHAGGRGGSAYPRPLLGCSEPYGGVCFLLGERRRGPASWLAACGVAALSSALACLCLLAGGDRSLTPRSTLPFSVRSFFLSSFLSFFFSGAAVPKAPATQAQAPRPGIQSVCV